MPYYLNMHIQEMQAWIFFNRRSRTFPGDSKLIRTGIKIELPKGTEAQIRPRSSLALKHQITILNTPGTVDEGYRCEIGVIIINHGKADSK